MNTWLWIIIAVCVCLTVVSEIEGVRTVMFFLKERKCGNIDIHELRMSLMKVIPSIVLIPVFAAGTIWLAATIL